MYCRHCDGEIEVSKNKKGKIDECSDCASDVDCYTGNMIYDHKTGCDIQINSDPRLTQYIINATKLRNKGSNLGNNLKVNSSMAKSNGLVRAVQGHTRRRD
jgi:hypothetical protein